MFETELRVENLYKSFGDKRVLEGIGFDVESGSATGLLGRNGAGKTTTIRIVMGVFLPDSGSVLIDGAPIDHKKINIGYLPEERGLYAKNRIYEQLFYLARLKGMEPKQAKDSIDYWLKRLEMTSAATKKLDALSKGNQQKIQLAAALISDPEIIILDEPFSGLDPVNATLLKDVVKERIAAGKIVLFSSHQMNYVEEFCDKIAILHNGKIAVFGGIDEIKRGYKRDRIIIESTAYSNVAAYLKSGLPDIVKEVTIEGDHVSAILKAEDLKDKLFLALAEKHFDIDAFYVFEPSLADIFVQYTGGGIEGEGEQTDEAV